jgi:hypothetical protein
MAFPGPLPSRGLITEVLKTFLSSLLGIHRERLAPIQQYPNICGVTIRPEEKKKKIRTLHKKVKGCGTRQFNPLQSMVHPLWGRWKVARLASLLPG